MNISRNQLLEVQHRKWDEEIHDVVGVYVLPSGRKHDSGFACMDFVAHTRGGQLIRFGGGCDDVRFVGGGFRMDCFHPSRIVHIWNSRKPFYITHDLSSIEFVEEAQP